VTLAPPEQPRLTRIERVRSKLTRAPSPAAVAAQFEVRGRTARCASLVDVEGRDILNLGCSFGWFEEVARDRGARRVVGVDTSTPSLEVARRRVPSAEFIRASAFELPFADAEFDVVTAFDVLEHLPLGKDGAMLGEMRRVVRTDGVVAFSTPHHHWLANYADPAYYFGHRHYRIEQVESLVADAHLRIETLSVAGAGFDLADVMLYYTWRHLFARERHPFDWIRRQAEREWRRSGGRNELLVVARPR
jgi:ubiquinone/menaquinone biosynthesis C-methylase UbiE